MTLRIFRYLQIILVRAERAWAYAMDLKQFANTESRKQVHLKAKLKKAVQYAEELETAVKALIDADVDWPENCVKEFMKR